MTERRGLLEAISVGPVVLDAAIGTRLIARGLDLARDDPALWNLTHPEDVLDLHRRDVAAGADALLTNTFGVSRVGDPASIVRAAVALAREAAEPTRWVIGSIGPGPRLIEAAEALADAGVDALLFETFRADQAAEALGQVSSRSRLPWLVSLFDWAEPMGDVARRLADRGASALGINCVSGMGPALRVAERLAALSRLPLLVKPSAGLPGEAMASPESFAAAVPTLLDRNVRLIGGCCGTDERHVAAIRTACYDWPKSRPRPNDPGHEPS